VLDAGQILGRGIAFPPRVGPDGRLGFSTGEQNVRESIEIILRTEQRERLRTPRFGGGLAAYLFEPNTPATWRGLEERIEQALGLWEPRVAVDSVNVIADPGDVAAAIATIDYHLVATQASGSATVTVPLEG
jgi:phage baseplate assembly protein W